MSNNDNSQLKEKEKSIKNENKMQNSNNNNQQKIEVELVLKGSKNNESIKNLSPKNDMSEERMKVFRRLEEKRFYKSNFRGWSCCFPVR